MDAASARWFTELDVADYEFVSQCNINHLADFTTQETATALGENLQLCFSSESHSSYPTLNTKNTNSSNTNTPSGSSIETSITSLERPSKQSTTNSWNSNYITTTEHQSPTPSSPSSQILSFETTAPPPPPTDFLQFYRDLDVSMKPNDEAAVSGNMNFQPSISNAPCENQSYGPKAKRGTKRPHTVSRNPSLAQGHILAERKRREKLNQRFIALSAIVPGLKKIDKASVLGDTIKYLKQLQERVKVLEEQTKKKTVESVVFVKKSQLSADEDCSSINDKSDVHSGSALPEIEARASDKDVLIRIHCEKQQGVLVKILKEIENLHLSIVNSSAMPFGNSTLEIAIIAQMDAEFSMTVKDVVKNLRLAFLKCM